MRKISPEFYCTVGVAAFIGGLFLFLIGLESNGDVYLLGQHFFSRNVRVFGTLCSMVGGAAATYGVIHLRKPPNSN